VNTLGKVLKQVDIENILPTLPPNERKQFEDVFYYAFLTNQKRTDATLLCYKDGDKIALKFKDENGFIDFPLTKNKLPNLLGMEFQTNLSNEELVAYILKKIIKKGE